ncbi:glycogen debranching protein GlgX [Xenophilus arseniciresistens]|uniref:Glycogen debranching protein GlgX n=1 Tax=Xenophilus arseniciresistens TaxID=1283306 RepID=A0AAE3NBE2_9BURK|nr:glycogen debranching protein GlgX [Xenophilus arseniciresistens]MDA7418223.1 glycogen debranching protein GlgX [Xenophilus arseniciresistens]
MLNEGHPYPLGATLLPDGGGVNFALAAPTAEAVELCLFDATGRSEQQRLRLGHCTDGVWHGLLPSAREGLVYGWRVHGPWSPHEGLRFNAAKLLLDPHAREVVGVYGGQDIFMGHVPGQPQLRDARDNGALALKARVCGPLPDAGVPRPRVAAADRVLYEAHVRSQTRLHPDVPEALRGSYAGLAQPAVLDHLQRLGVTTLSLMPVQHRADEDRLQKLGLANHWGYSPIGWMAPEARYWSGRPGSSPRSEFRALADALHARGMELVIDVVFNHSAETDELGPTLSLRGIDSALYYRLRADDASLYENWSGCGNCLDFSQPRVVQLAMDSLRAWVTELGVDGFRFDLAPVLGRGAGGGFDARAPFFAACAQDPVLSQALLIAEPWDIGPGGYQLGAFAPGWLEWNDRFRDTQRAFWLHAGSAEGTTRGALAHRLLASSAEFRHDARAPTASVNFICAHDGFTLADLLSHDRRHNEANGEQGRDGHSHNLSANQGVEGPTDDPAVQARRRTKARALLAALMLSQGTPMLLAGDELGHSQGGNNNAYCQDNATTWLDWARADESLAAYVGRLAALRRAAAPLRHSRWWSATAAPGEDAVHWLQPGGGPLTPADWEDPLQGAMAVLFEPASARTAAQRWLLLINAGATACRFVLPPGAWDLHLASDAMDGDAMQQAPAPRATDLQVPASSLWLLSSSRTAAA